METRVLIRSGPKPNGAPTPIMLQMKFDYDWPAGLRDIHVCKCGRTVGHWLESHPISSPGDFGSGELKISRS